MGFKETMLTLIGVDISRYDSSEPLTNSSHKCDKSCQTSERKLSRESLPKYEEQKEKSRLTVISPKAYEDGYKIADIIKGGNAVIVDFSSAEHETAHNLFDFITGAAFALEGGAERITPNVYIFTPSNTKIVTK